MEAKKKAFELMHKFFPSMQDSLGLELIGIRKKHAKQCALIAVDEIIEFHGNYCSECQDDQDEKLQYLLEVKQEIYKL